MAQNVPGRHRAPGRFNAISELKTIAKESAQPAVKGAAIVAASGGLVASFAGTANAADGSASTVAGPAAVGPAVGTLKAGNALSAIGFAKPALKQASVKPVVIEDVQVKSERAAKKAAEKAAADREATQQRASRSASRAALNVAPDPSATGIIGIAQSFFGVPYVYGGTTPSGFDCSGFTSYVYRQAGISIPRTASAQAAASTPVSNPRPGDLVFFGSPIYHVGIYVSPGRMIDAQRPGTVIGNHSIWTTPSMYGRI
ncbi:C40 family peptidase [Terracoccus sp. 273MFTsu3.1]|uniref:C40 family peptidase n=1 Tax=Terracoccus sp. 273MFTsu3.1 TaxID=1172188 RepID=UPI00036D30B5|nr:C40 family peptidase [Terracoccus sp. 273MFTsu3.1]